MYRKEFAFFIIIITMPFSQPADFEPQAAHVLYVAQGDGIVFYFSIMDGGEDYNSFFCVITEIKFHGRRSGQGL